MKSMIHRATNRPSCEVYVEDGYLYGNGQYMVKSFYGERWVKTPWRIDIHGPAEVSYYDTCSDFVLLTPKVHFFWIIPGMLFLLFSFLLLPYLRFLKLKKELKSCGISYKWGCCKLTTKGASGTKKISYLRLFLYFYCLTSFTVEGCVPKDRFIGNHSFFTAQVFPNEMICTTKGDLIINNKLFMVSLNELYTTYDWEFKRESDWACGGVGASCPEIDVCNSINNNLTFQHGNIYRQFCKSYQQGCVGKRGCKFGRDIIYLMKKYKVFSLDGVKDKLHINKFQNDHCSVILASNPIVNFHNYKMVNYENDWFLCNGVSNKGHPTLGTIGSVQSIKDSFSIDWEGFKCDEGWFDKSNCQYKKHGLIKDICISLPNNVNGVNYYIHNYELFFTTDSQALTVVGSCNSNLVHGINDCYDTKVEMYGHRNSEYGLYIRVKGSSKSHSELGEITLNCTNQHKLQFVCNDQYHNFPISSLEVCHNLLDESITQGFVYKEVSTDNTKYLTDYNFHSESHALFAIVLMIIFILIFLAVVKCFLKCLL